MSYKPKFQAVFDEALDQPSDVSRLTAFKATCDLAVSFLNVMKVVRQSELASVPKSSLSPDQDVYVPGDEFHTALVTALGDAVNLWPNSPVLTVHNGRAMHQFQLAFGDWVESAVHALACEKAGTGPDTAELRQRAVGLRETHLSVVVNMLQTAGVKVHNLDRFRSELGKVMYS